MSAYPHVLIATLLTVSAAVAQALPVSTQSYAAKPVNLFVLEHAPHTLLAGSAGPAVPTFVSASAHNPGSPEIVDTPQPRVWLLLFAAVFAASAVLRRSRD